MSRDTSGSSSSGSSSSSSDQGDVYLTIKLSPEPSPAMDLKVDGLEATEELGRPFLIEVDVSSGDVKGDLSTLLGSSVTVTTTDENANKEYFNGILTRAQYLGFKGGVYHYRFELRPTAWLLSQTHDCKIFQNQSAFQIITTVLGDVGVTAADKRQNQAGDTTLEYCVQYSESKLDFVTRLMEQFGLYYFFTHSDGDHTLNIADDPSSHTALSAALPFLLEQGEVQNVENHVWEFAADHHLQPGAFTFKDYNFTTPAADLTAKSTKSFSHPHNSLEIYHYPGGYTEVSEGQKRTDVRIQDLRARAQMFDGSSNARPLRCGAKFTLSGFPDDALNKEYLVTRAITRIGAAEGGADTRGGHVDAYDVAFTAQFGTEPFRLEQKTERPRIRGPQTAIVVGDSGEEVTTDQYGRVKVQFYWDRIGTKDQNSSCWIRVAQSWAGAGWGAIFIPRIGMEVVVEFLEGDPDRPLITGVVYNATQTVPNTLPDKKVVTTIKSNSSKGGGGYNELTFDDTKGSEVVTFQAQKDYKKTVLNNETVDITQDTTTTVKQGNRSVTVSQGNDDHTVSQGNRSVTVSQGNDTHTVSAGNRKAAISAGNDEVTAGQSIKLTANTSIELTVGGTSLKLDSSGITYSGPKISGSASGEMELSGGGMMTLSAGMIKIN
jgi:type VI secretion system secreted protein VgrG